MRPPTDRGGLSSGLKVALAAAATVIVVAGLKTAAPIVNFFLVALFVAVVAAVPVDWLHRRGLPPGLGASLVILALLAVALVMTLLLAGSAARFSAALPEYQRQIDAQLAPWLSWLQSHGIALNRPSLFPELDPNNVLGLVAGLLGNVGNLLSNGVLILLVAVFMLIDSAAFQRQLQAVSPDPARAADRWAVFTHSLRGYLAIKTWTSLVTGLGVGLWTSLTGLDSPVIWGLLAFFFNYVPNIGSILAALPALLLALIQGGAELAALVALGYLLINVVIGYLVEPRLMGRGAGLSASVVLLSLIFWGWVLGPVGMILAVPLTVTLKLALDSSDDTRWMARLLDVKTTAEPTG